MRYVRKCGFRLDHVQAELLSREARALFYSEDEDAPLESALAQTLFLGEGSTQHNLEFRHSTNFGAVFFSKLERMSTRVSVSFELWESYAYIRVSF